VNQPIAQSEQDQTPRRRVAGRERLVTAPARCACFAAWSELTASPHDIDPRPALRKKIGVSAALDYAGALDELLGTFVDVDLERLKSAYSGLFEVGSDGPPVPIREDLQTGMRGGTREGIVRFYNFFGYSLADNFAWAPDHLSVQLEFMHFLCYREATAESDEDALSYQLAQVDFMERHINRWVGLLADGVAAHSPDSLYARVTRSLNEFLAEDYSWQNSTVVLLGDAGT
jgi:DMSO reductase family type II enzyme chaperone